jgi:hypothetical protein
MSTPKSPERKSTALFLHKNRSSKPLVYIASPYSRGVPSYNVRASAAWWDCLYREGVVLPVCPLWSHFQDLMFPLSYEHWMHYDLQLIEHCDACFRVPARGETGRPNELYREDRSSGADREVIHCQEQGIPVFTDRVILYEWVSEWSRERARG